jgi:hypothetical protein
MTRIGAVAYSDWTNQTAVSLGRQPRVSPGKHALRVAESVAVRLVPLSSQFGSMSADLTVGPPFEGTGSGSTGTTIVIYGLPTRFGPPVASSEYA